MKMLLAVTVCAVAFPLLSTAAQLRPYLTTGEVITEEAQQIVVPQSNTNPVVLRSLVADGAKVKAGDVVLRIDPGGTAQQAEQLRTQVAQAIARTNKEVADLEVKAIDAETAWAQADAMWRKAKIDGAIPRAQLSALDADRYAGELARTERNREQLQKALDEARAAVDRKREDARLEIRKLEVQRIVADAQLQASEVKAEQDGVFIAGFHPWHGRRYTSGESAQSGFVAGQVVTPGKHGIRAYALENDRMGFSLDKPVSITIDAFPGHWFNTRILRIAGAPEQRKPWGNGRYYTMAIEIPSELKLPLKPGMSVLALPGAAPVKTESLATEGRGSPLTLQGEIEAAENQSVAPPGIPNTWNFNLTMLVPEGTMVQPGMPVAVFDAAELAPTIAEKTAQLNEKQQLANKLRLDHAEAAKQADLSVSEAEAKAEKTVRKASQPESLIRRVDYSKFVVEREEAQQLLEIAQRRHAALGRARDAERALTQAEVNQLQGEIKSLTEGQQKLTVTAQRAGMVIHQSGWDGDRFTTGSQVFIGQSVATVADTATLRVRAQVPEALSLRVLPGQAARIEVSGSTLQMSGSVIEVGRAYRAKSNNEPINILDVMLKLDQGNDKLKPGASVRVFLTESKA
ncbi:MAG: HlyD family efflux transporter periplasmic adaptor subunit [Ahniella sp.]|nr:HlyD family efflux transporter periplasmic adaptor subunit [Ahniella sp.]